LRNIKSWLLFFVAFFTLAACTTAGVPQGSKATSQLTATSVMTPAACPITSPEEMKFTPPSLYPATPPAEYGDQFWYGSRGLWTMLRKDGTWSGLPYSKDGYTQKVFWWREGYKASAEPSPALTVTGTRLDASAPPLRAPAATNASADFGQAMLVGVTIPTPGCWKITGRYNGHELSFVIWVTP
jgi:hypothetical protein